jgi:hypothetical protein
LWTWMKKMKRAANRPSRAWWVGCFIAKHQLCRFLRKSTRNHSFRWCQKKNNDDLGCCIMYLLYCTWWSNILVSSKLHHVPVVTLFSLTLYLQTNRQLELVPSFRECEDVWR